MGAVPSPRIFISLDFHCGRHLACCFVIGPTCTASACLITSAVSRTCHSARPRPFTGTSRLLPHRGNVLPLCLPPGFCLQFHRIYSARHAQCHHPPAEPRKEGQDCISLCLGSLHHRIPIRVDRRSISILPHLLTGGSGKLP